MKMMFLLLSLLLFPALEATQLVKAQACWDSLLNSLGKGGNDPRELLLNNI